MRLLGSLVIVLGLVGSADAQVFKPKGKKSDATEKKSAKSPKKKAAKKSGKAKKSKSAAAERSRPDDLTPEAGSTDEDDDFVKITDDDDIE